MDGPQRSVLLGAARRRLPLVPVLQPRRAVVRDLCVRLLKEPYRTYLIPGSCYGDDFEGRVRLGFGPGTATDEIRAGLDAIDAFAKDQTKGGVMS